VSSAAARSRFAHSIRGSALQAERTFSYVLRGVQRLDRLPFVRVFGFRPRDALSEPYVFEDFTFRQVQQFRRSVPAVRPVAAYHVPPLSGRAKRKGKRRG
jgi:hypothetical protein